MKCEQCKKEMKKIERSEHMVDLEEDATEGQEADYYAAELSGDYGEWKEASVTYICDRCITEKTIYLDELRNYDELIYHWHKKAESGDYFSRYVFEYISFNAYLKCHIALEEVQDRQAIQSLKRNNHEKNKYLKLISKNKTLREIWCQLIEELSSQPLLNASRDIDFPRIDNWWNSSQRTPNIDTDLPKGIIHNTQDWENMIEFWNGVRNNLFHAGKSPNFARDQFLVESAYLTLSEYMSMNLKK